MPLDVSVARLELAQLHQVNLALLGLLSLFGQHREDLRRRGFSDADIDRIGFRSLPRDRRAALARQLAGRFGEEMMLQFPGYSIRTDEEKGRSWASIGGYAGLVIPLRDADQKVPALLIRPDEPGEDGPKYAFLSSSSHDGPSALPVVNVPAFGGAHEEVVLTEGGLKSYAATVLGGRLVLGLPGVSHVEAAVVALRKLGARCVLLAFDADMHRNRHVAAAQLRAIEVLRRESFAVRLLLWSEKLGKGLDDLYLAGHQPQVIGGVNG